MAHFSERLLLAQVLKKTSISYQPTPAAYQVISRLHFKRVLSLEPFFASLVGLDMLIPGSRR
jgi:threonine/homoserine efflux transporter RhtA